MTDYTVYTAPYGDDANPGTLEAPVRTLAEALSRTRGRSAGARRIVVREGCHYDVSLALTAEDADLTIEAYPNEHPVLYGGLPASGWEREGFCWTAAIAGAGDRTRDFRLIEVGGEARTRARLPAAGAFRHRNEFNVDWMSTYGGGWRRKPTEAELTVLHVESEDMGPELDANNAEITVFHEWDESLVAIKDIDAASGTITFANIPGSPPGAFIDRNENARTYVVWNVREGMTSPGKWYLDRTNGKLVYWPLPSENPDTIDLVVPSREHIIQFATGAKRIRFQGLTFSCSAAALVAGGFGAIEASAAITGEAIEEVTFENVTVRSVGGWAFKLSGKRIRWIGCEIRDTGAGGIHFDGEGVVLEKTRIARVGLVYGSAVAVHSVGRSHRIHRNEIHETPYCGIVSVSPDTTIDNNLIYDTMTFLKDGAAIYIAHDSRNVVVSGNAVFSRTDAPERRYAYYLDERCVECTVENNLAVNLGVPMLSHMTDHCRFANNIFLDRGPQTVSVLNSFGLRFERNVLVAHSIDVRSPIGNPQGLPSEYDSHAYMSAFSAADGIVSFANNVICAANGHNAFREILHYKQIGERPIAETNGNVFDDPLFHDPASGDFSFAEDSPAPRRGIRPLSFADVGFSGAFREKFRQYDAKP